MLVIWIDEGKERAARFTMEAEARNFIEHLRLRHHAQDIQLLDADGVRVESPASTS
jgi:hypothetical protein